MPTSATSAILPYEWLSKSGLVGFVTATESYCAGENEYPDLPPPLSVRLDTIRPPQRSPGVADLVEKRALSILGAIASNAALPPIRLYAVPDGPYEYRLGDGFHRFTISRALGFSAIPAAVLDYWEPWMTGDPMP